jgi:hypothetical protein
MRYSDLFEAKKPPVDPIKEKMRRQIKYAFNGKEWPNTMAMFFNCWTEEKTAILHHSYSLWNASRDPNSGDDVYLIVGYNPEKNKVQGWVVYTEEGEYEGDIIGDPEDLSDVKLIIKNLRRSGQSHLADYLEELEPTV